MTQISPIVSFAYASTSSAVKPSVEGDGLDVAPLVESDSVSFSVESLALAESAFSSLPPDDLPTDDELDDLIGDDPIPPYP